MDVSGLSDQQLTNLIQNHRDHRATDRPLYAQAMEELHGRNAGELSLETSIAFLKHAARERRFVSYGELAAANGVAWERARYPMNTHLWILVDHAHRQGWPMLSAIVVNKRHTATGQMDPETLAGFIMAAQELGYLVADEAAFLKDQQELCFAWGSD